MKNKDPDPKFIIIWPHYGVLDNTKAKSNFNINNKNWRDSLSSMINKLT